MNKITHTHTHVRFFFFFFFSLLVFPVVSFFSIGVHMSDGRRMELMVQQYSSQQYGHTTKSEGENKDDKRQPMEY